jgi:hypothetical protein
MAAVLLCATSGSAQTTPPPAAPTTAPAPRATRPADERTTTRDGANPTLTVEGCLVREADVPGQRPSATERMGVGRDFVLANATITRGLPERGAAGTSGTQGAHDGTRPASGTPDTPERGGAGTLSPGSPRVGEENPAGTTGLGTDPKAVEQTARTAQSAARATGHTFKIEGLDKDQLEPHVGKRVRITGTVESLATLTGGTPQRGGSTGDTSGGTGASSAGASSVGSGRTGASGTGTAAGTGTAQAGAPSSADRPIPELDATTVTALGGACSATRPQ